MTEAVCKTVHTEHLAAFGRVQYKSKQGMEALYTPIISIRQSFSDLQLSSSALEIRCANSLL